MATRVRAMAGPHRTWPISMTPWTGSMRISAWRPSARPVALSITAKNSGSSVPAARSIQARNARDVSRHVVQQVRETCFRAGLAGRGEQVRLVLFDGQRFQACVLSVEHDPLRSRDARPLREVRSHEPCIILRRGVPSACRKPDVIAVRRAVVEVRRRRQSGEGVELVDQVRLVREAAIGRDARPSPRRRRGGQGRSRAGSGARDRTASA